MNELQQAAIDLEALQTKWRGQADVTNDQGIAAGLREAADDLQEIIDGPLSE